MKFSVRKAGPAEAAEAFELIEEYYNEVGVVVRDNRTQLGKYLSDDRSGIWLAWENSLRSNFPWNATAIGCILRRPLPEMQRSCEIKRLYVRPSCRGSGVADAMLRSVEEYAAAQGILWLYLDTKQDLRAAIRFYERSGYQRCERYNDNPQATIFMRKQLA